MSLVREAGVRTLVDVRRFLGSRHNPQFNEPALRAVLEGGRIAYRHALELPSAAFASPRSAAMRPEWALRGGRRRSPRRWQNRLPA